MGNPKTAPIVTEKVIIAGIRTFSNPDKIELNTALITRKNTSGIT